MKRQAYKRKSEVRKVHRPYQAGVAAKQKRGRQLACQAAGSAQAHSEVAGAQGPAHTEHAASNNC